MPVRKRMSVRDWNSLSFSDKEILKTLNLLDILKPKRNRSPRAEPKVLPKPYILIRISTCRLCRTITENYFRMLPAKENPYILKAQRITPENILSSENIVEKEESCATCLYCHKVLEKETKGELIKRILLLEGRRR